jgi:hypothetical protein
VGHTGACPFTHGSHSQSIGPRTFRDLSRTTGPPSILKILQPPRANTIPLNLTAKPYVALGRRYRNVVWNRSRRCLWISQSNRDFHLHTRG